MMYILMFLAGATTWWALTTHVAAKWPWFRAKYVYDELADARDMHLKFGFLAFGEPGHVTRRLLKERIACMREELDEFAEAVDDQFLAGQADALVDLVYFAKGTAVMLGLPWEELWDDVHRANMAKVPGVGKRGHQVDLIKPDGWEEPNTLAILYMNGYAPDNFGSWRIHNGDEILVCNETLCRDYPAFKVTKP